MAQGGDYDHNSIAQWLTKIGTENAKVIASEAEKFSSELCNSTTKARDELVNLPDCPSSLDSKRKDFFNSMDNAKSSAEGLKGRCLKLCEKWDGFADDFKKSSSDKKSLSSDELDKLLEDMQKLLKKCEACEEQYSETRARLSTAINDCSLLVEELAKEAARKREEESNRKQKGYGAAAVFGLGAAAATVATAGTAAPVVMFAAGSLTTVCVGTAAWTNVTSGTLRSLSETFSQARGRMNATLRELNRLSNLISSLEKNTAEMEKNIETGRNREKRVKDALDKKERKERKLLAKLAELGISVSSDSDDL
ncbi:hypothetical protein BOX15_Mlig013860g2 [Macrostomum lignano]|uniref:Uncharacterized protein n=1 Tax=Macrostomum lignano TaxID=282301 RepID=A0A267G6H1_9PLAT|nr:hypothetical protein BOX15_Mlig013860g2 [Macrostomum lignano]